MKPFKNKLAVTIVVLSVAFLGIIVLSIKGNSNIISSGVGGVISPLQKIVYTVNEKVKGSFDFFINFSNVKKENEELTAKNAELENKLNINGCLCACSGVDDKIKIYVCSEDMKNKAIAAVLDYTLHLKLLYNNDSEEEFDFNDYITNTLKIRKYDGHPYRR